MRAPNDALTGPAPALLPAFTRVLAVCAHPDDESFGLGAVLATLHDAGASLSVVCFTHGEASTLHGAAGELGEVRAAELEAAAAVLGVGRTELLDYPDGGLDRAHRDELVRHVWRVADEVGADLLLAFDEGGVTGHLDHEVATEAAVGAASELEVPVLAWTVPRAVADALNAQFGTRFVGREPAAIDHTIAVERVRQREAIACHASQSADNPVLWRRLELLGAREHLRYLAS